MPEEASAQTTAPHAASLSAWEPLKLLVFRMLWCTWLVANICMWMNDVAE